MFTYAYTDTQKGIRIYTCVTGMSHVIRMSKSLSQGQWHCRTASHWVSHWQRLTHTCDVIHSCNTRVYTYPFLCICITSTCRATVLCRAASSCDTDTQKGIRIYTCVTGMSHVIRMSKSLSHVLCRAASSCQAACLRKTCYMWVNTCVHVCENVFKGMRVCMQIAGILMYECLSICTESQYLWIYVGLYVCIWAVCIIFGVQ